MKYEVYEGIRVTDDFEMFDFGSIGSKGIILKRVLFTETELKNVYNLTFGDVDENGEIDDYAVSNNGDRNKVLATIAHIVQIYTKRYPDRWILFEGSTTNRTRLYRIAVGSHLEELSTKFDIYAYVDERIVPFAKDIKINAFLIKRKFINLNYEKDHNI